MTRWLPRSSTGTRAGAALAALGAVFALAAAPVPAHGQALKLATLHVAPTTVVGPWVSYRVRSKTRSLPVREYTQRVAVVARERHARGDGFWVELKTEGLSSGRRIERGFFVPRGSGGGSGSFQGSGAGAPSYDLERYQVLHSNGKLYEYPAERVQSLRADGDVSTIELFEYDPDMAPVFETLGPDTLRLGKRVVPVQAERTLRTGANAWPTRGDTSYVNRPLLVQTLWKNTSVPVTGLARSLFQVVTELVPVSEREAPPSGASAPPVPPHDPVITGAASARKDTTSVARADSSAAGTTAPAAGSTPGARAPFAIAPVATTVPSAAAARPITMLSWTDLILMDLGADAKPEVTQEPELLPEDAPLPPSGGR